MESHKHRVSQLTLCESSVHLMGDSVEQEKFAVILNLKLNLLLLYLQIILYTVQ